MKIRRITVVLGLALLLPACRKAEVKVDESRSLTMRDEGMLIDANSNQRFEKPGSQPYIPGIIPEGWREMAPTELRLLNFAFGGSGGEVYVSKARGGMADNVNRWRRQLDAAPLGDAEIARLEQGSVLGVPGLWVEAEGEFTGMAPNAPGAAAPRKGWGLYGIIAETNGEIITVKMTGPAAEVSAQKTALKSFVAGLRKRGE